jgi:hypothetical protein
MLRRSSLGRAPLLVLSVLVGTLLTAGVVAAGQTDRESGALTVPVTRPAATTVASTTTLPPTTTTTPPPPPPPPVTVAAAEVRRVLETGFRPLVSAAGVIVNYPAARVEKVGFHESNKAGARWMDVLPNTGETFDMPTRDRKTPGRTAADVLADPAGEVRAPVTGRVIRGGTYVLYCKYTDSFLVIEPDAHPGWEVKVLHISGLVVRTGQRVEAGVTPIAAHPTRLPFASQVEDYSAKPVWPHVHIEVVDPTIKNPPGVGGGGCS